MHQEPFSAAPTIAQNRARKCGRSVPFPLKADGAAGVDAPGGCLDCVVTREVDAHASCDLGMNGFELIVRKTACGFVFLGLFACNERLA